MLKKLSKTQLILIITAATLFIALIGFVLVKSNITKKFGLTTSPCKLIVNKNDKLNCLLNEAGLDQLILTPEEEALENMFNRSAGVFGANVEMPLFKTIGFDNEGQPINVINDTVSMYMAKKLTQCTYLADRYYDSAHNGGCPVVKIGWENDSDRSDTIESINLFINDKL